MKKLMSVIAAGAMALTFLLVLPGISAAAGYLKIGDIKGESTDRDHKDWIIIESISAPATAATSGQTTGRRQHQPVVITKPVDKATPKLQEASTSGKLFEKVFIEIATSEKGRGTYLRYELTNVVITSYSGSGSAAGDVPMEEFSLNYEEIKTTSVSAEDNRRDKERRNQRDR